MPKLIINDLSGGLNKDFPVHMIDRTELSDSNNLVYRQGIWTKRDGYTLPYNATGDTNEVLELYEHRDVAGNTFLLSATKKNIYVLSGTSWDSELTLGTARATADKWFFTSHNNNVWATNGVDSIYHHTDLNTTATEFSAVSWDTSTDAGGNAGKTINSASVVLYFNGRLLLFDTDDSVDGHVPKRMQWTEVLDFDRVETSNFADMPTGNSPIIHAKPMGRGLLAVYQKDAVSIVQDTGDPLYFVPRFTKNNIGLLAPKAVTDIPSGDFFVSNEGFFIFQGGGIQSVGDDRVVSHFFSQLSDSNADNTYCFTDWRNREVYILYSTSADQPDKYLIYNWQYDNWTEGDFNAYCGLHQFIGTTTPVNLFGSSSGNVKKHGGSDDDGTAITTKLRTRAFRNTPNPNEPDAPEYVNTNWIATDADPTTATIFIGEHDLGTETPDTSRNSGVTLTDNDGRMRFADIRPVAGRYITIGVDNADTVSEFVTDWVSGGHR